MANVTGFGNIEKLTENNYELWKVQMKSVLVFNELWPYVDGTKEKPANNADDWIRKDSKALALINLSVTHGQLNHVKRAKLSKEAWDGLSAVHESRGPVRKAALYKQLLRMEKKPSTTMTQYVTEYTHKAEQLQEAGIDIPNELLSIMLLGSLPTEFENFSIAIESRDEIPSLDSLKIKLIEEEARQSDRNARLNDNESKNDALLSKGFVERSKQKYNNTKEYNANANKHKFIGKCFNCGKVGHKSQYCRLKTKHSVSYNSSDAMTVIACNTELAMKSKEWYLDSGATRHMSNDERNFAIMNENETKVYTAADHFIKSAGAGDVNIDTKLGRKVTNSVKLKDTLYVPGLRNNLLSVSSVTEKGYTVTFGKDKATINRKDGSVALTATRRDQLYVVNQQVQSAVFAGEKIDENLLKWHQRFGHLNVDELRKMKNGEIVSGMNFTPKVSEINCEVCAKCKIHVKPFNKSVSREKEVLGLIHSDICGPMKTESLGGANYFVTFIDDFSRYTETVMLRKRSDVLQAFKEYKRKVENQTGKRIKKIRTDNGKEYISKDFNDFLKEEGIIRQTSVEYTPQQNGVAERANRTLVEMARCMMLQAKVPDTLWAEAVNTATYLRNRCGTKCLEGITPVEAWLQKKPYVGFFRTFGSKTIALNKGQRRGKFQPKGDEYVLVGYSDESKAYRLWQPGTKKVIKARDVRFIEKIELPQASNEMFMPSDPFVETSNEEESHEDDRNENVSGEDCQTDEHENDEPRRGPGRPQILRTGKPGRPRKIYPIQNRQQPDPESASEILERDDRQEWLTAIKEEYATLKENGTWILVPRPIDKKVLTSRWLFKTKVIQNGEIEKHKARLVARGHTQKFGVDYEEIFAPVARYETIRTLFAAAVNEEMHIHQMDVISAYVQGELHDEIYMEQPEMFAEQGQEENVCKLLRPLYGLKQSGREWYQKLDGYITTIGGKRTLADPCVYVFGEGDDRVIVIIYVDDLILASKKIEELEYVKSNMKSTFKMVDLGPISNILGIKLQRDGATGKLHLSQERYVKELIEKFNMEHAKTVATPIESNLKLTKGMSPTTEDERCKMRNKPYKELVGGLIYLANATRPDIAFAASTLSRFCADPGYEHWLIAKRVLRYLKATSHYGITYIKDKENLKAYTDSDWAGDIDDRRSCSGNVLIFSGGPISWKSKKQASVALSTMEAEYAALSEVTREIVYIKRLLIHMGFRDYVKSPIKIFCDNQSAIELSKNAVCHKRSKHIDIAFHFTRELVDKKEIIIKYLQTDFMLADIFTKSLTKNKHNNGVEMLHLN